MFQFLLVLSCISFFFFLIVPLFLKLRHFTHALFMLVSTFINITTFLWLQFTSIHCHIIDILQFSPLSFIFKDILELFILWSIVVNHLFFFFYCQISVVMSLTILLSGISTWFWYLSCGITHEITPFDGKNAFHIHTINIFITIYNNCLVFLQH